MRPAPAIILAFVALVGCSTGKHAPDFAPPLSQKKPPEEPEGGTLDGHIIFPEGFPIGMSRVNCVQEWLAPGTPDPDDFERPDSPVPDVRQSWFSQLAVADDGSFQVQPQGKGPAMIWLEFRPNESDRKEGWHDPFECTLAAYLGSVDVPATGRINRDFDTHDICPGSIDVLVRVHGNPAPNMRVTFFSPGHLRDPLESLSKVIREGHRYVGGISVLTGEDGHARLSNMFAGEWACYVRPVDRSWSYISPDRAIVRVGGETLFGVDPDPRPYVLQFVLGDPKTMSPTGVMDAPTPLGGIEVWWQQRTALGLLGLGHGRTDADGTLTHEFPPGRFEFRVADRAGLDQNSDAAFDDGYSISRVNLAEVGAAPRQVYLRLP